jgi:hypothetical protein
MRRVGGEQLLAGEGGLQPGKHRVEGVAEFGELIGWPAQREPLMQVLAGDPLRRFCDLAQGPQHTPSHQPRYPARDHDESGQNGAILRKKARQDAHLHRVADDMAPSTVAAGRRAGIA